MKKITIILIRKILPHADDKTIVFVSAFLVALGTALWGPLQEVWDSFHEWMDYPLELKHIFKSHGPAVAGAIYLWWNTAKAANLLPDWAQDATLSEIKVTSEGPVTIDPQASADPK